MGTIYGNNGSPYWRVCMTYSTTQTPTTMSVTAYLYLYWSKHHSHNLAYDRDCLLAATGNTTKYFYPTGEVEYAAGGSLLIGYKTFSFARKKDAYKANIVGYINHKTSGPTGASKATLSFTVPSREKYTVTLMGDNSTWKSLTKVYGYTLTLPTTAPEKSGYSFKGWTTESGSTTVNYNKGGSYTANQNAILYPVWQTENPPEINDGDLPELTRGTGQGDNFIKRFTDIIATINKSDIHLGKKEGTTTDRDLQSITLTVGDMSSTVTSFANDTITVTIPMASVLSTGEFTPTLEVVDEYNASSLFYLSPITIHQATWKKTIEVSTATAKIPDVDRNGNAIITYEKKNYTTNEYDVVTEEIKPTSTATGWSFVASFTENYVDDNDSSTVNAEVRLSYIHTETDENEAREVFFKSTRNANYSNGISNTMFIGGCTEPKYASRVWWSKINNPLYFPDTNYVEVGSNDTSVMGLCKVGDYLGVVKQSKATDTAVFLVYPTSFEDETTYAVKQGVSGVGALSKYSFNILGGETLFLSPDGVMAIVPSEDEEHKLQNRSFFVDGKLLTEPGLDGSYSFVFDGMYYLATGNSCYVLDGNQKNSWGNDKTNLVYEGYYLDNIPAKCFMKYEDMLWFSSDTELCKFKEDSFIDGYDITTGEARVPVKAEWSTILDDDGSLHYYKTMQKKGNVISIFPVDGEPYVQAYVTQEEFNADKTKYYTLVDGVYVRCTESSVYNSNESYYIVNVNTSAKVYIKKDAEELAYIGEVNGKVETTGDIPNELHIRKKIKKYKRLAFVLRNENNEDFGVDSITKSYYLGNYAK